MLPIEFALQQTLPPDWKAHRFWIYNTYYTDWSQLLFPPGRVAAVRGVAEALALPGVIEACVEPRPGDRIDAVHDGRSRPGHVLVWGRDRAEVQRLIGDVRRRIRLDYEEATDVAPIELPSA